MPSGVLARWVGKTRGRDHSVAIGAGRRAVALLVRIPAAVAILLVTIYRVAISPLLPPACSFEPTCSAYTLEALRRHGLIRGMGLGARRLLRCRPGHPGGFDPVP